MRQADDDADRLVRAYDGNWNTTARGSESLYGDHKLPSPQLAGHITSDHLHTPRAISNASGTVTWTWAPVSGNSTSGGSNVFGDRTAQMATREICTHVVIDNLRKIDAATHPVGRLPGPSTLDPEG